MFNPTCRRAFSSILFALLSLSLASLATAAPQQVTWKGHNRQAVFVSSDAFVFVSTSRKAHKDSQLYFKDLKTGKEKRITHQKGHLANGFYISQEGQLFYSSTTDEEKETPDVLKKQLDRFPSNVKNNDFFHINFSPQEIYKSQLDGTQIERVTEFSGYDGFPAYLSKKGHLYFSRWKNNKIDLFAKSLTRNLAPWKVTQTAGHDLGLKVSPDEKHFTWFRFSPDFRSSQVLLSDLDFKTPKYLTLETGVNWSPSWHPNGQSILYSARAANKTNFDIFEVSVDGECQRQITSASGDEFFPTVSPDGKKILFTSTQAGHEQIFKMDYPSKFDCPKAQ